MGGRIVGYPDFSRQRQTGSNRELPRKRETPKTSYTILATCAADVPLLFETIGYPQIRPTSIIEDMALNLN
jgi:hypothetical protein